MNSSWEEVRQSFLALEAQVKNLDVDPTQHRKDQVLVHAKALWADTTWFIERLKKKDGDNPRS